MTQPPLAPGCAATATCSPNAPTSDGCRTLRLAGKPPKYIGIDVDNTFHTYDAAAMAKNRRAFRKLVESGYRPVLVTGRMLKASLGVLDDLYTDGVYRGYPGVYQNGATVYNELGELIVTVSFSKSFIRDVCDILEEHRLGAHVLFQAPNEYYALAHDKDLTELLARNLNLPSPVIESTADEICGAEITHILCYRFDKVQLYMDAKPEVDYVAREGAMEITCINPPRVNKLEGLRALLGHENAESGDFAFIGDGSNDVEALQASQWSFAVGNASDSVKASAKNVLEETNDQAAFAKMAQLLYGINVE
ncbi:HAD superfamily hydrolase, putative [Babesia bigemina]|uniref:HAD superfamily hydrolase, putative n=1 Tax=Babesia bigemina TaxID=5866 RepID=A0A061D3Z4_BABBI|nr:HAD superfamily hydrolase, putative [Babesia bigemina]CDR94772.1 HAD superfamily hydrolase, putative [Babesia bigemina]|eukprot:XP_012766958.1 HAD superfamily hydrolase, putative [Babesia bigemina]